MTGVVIRGSTFSLLLIRLSSSGFSHLYNIFNKVNILACCWHSSVVQTEVAYQICALLNRKSTVN